MVSMVMILSFKDIVGTTVSHTGIPGRGCSNKHPEIPKF
jgi:hypothetical protein